MGIYKSDFTEGKDLRELRVIIISLLKKGIQMNGLSLMEISGDKFQREGYLKIQDGMYESSLLKNIIEHSVRHYFSTPGEVSDFSKEIDKAKNSHLVDRTKFTWLKDPVAGYWLWCYIRQESIGFHSPIAAPPSYERVIFNPFDSKNTVTERFNFIPRFYDSSGLAKQPNNFNDVFESIVGFFDHWEIKKSDKENVLVMLKLKWGRLYNWEIENGKPFSFLKKNDSEGIRWCWEYFKSRVKNIYWEQFQPATSLERYHYIFGVFYAWESTPEARRLFLMEASRAWSQRKFRAKRGNKKAFQTYMHEETKERLVELAEKNGLKINEVLDKIINDAYILMLNLSDDDNLK